VNEDFGNDYITITDDEGNEFEMEHLDTLEMNGVIYMAFLPADMDEDDEDFGLIVLKVIEKDDEELLTTLDNDDELGIVYERFIERLTEDLDDTEDGES
jgi:uncharacterized protein YrzB (UPF0473 family)